MGSSSSRHSNREREEQKRRNREREEQQQQLKNEVDSLIKSFVTNEQARQKLASQLEDRLKQDIKSDGLISKDEAFLNGEREKRKKLRQELVRRRQKSREEEKKQLDNALERISDKQTLLTKYENHINGATAWEITFDQNAKNWEISTASDIKILQDINNTIQLYSKETDELVSAIESHSESTICLEKKIFAVIFQHQEAIEKLEKLSSALSASVSQFQTLDNPDLFCTAIDLERMLHLVNEVKPFDHFKEVDYLLTHHFNTVFFNEIQTLSNNLDHAERCIASNKTKIQTLTEAYKKIEDAKSKLPANEYLNQDIELTNTLIDKTLCLIQEKIQKARDLFDNANRILTNSSPKCLLAEKNTTIERLKASIESNKTHYDQLKADIAIRVSDYINHFKEANKNSTVQTASFKASSDASVNAEYNEHLIEIHSKLNEHQDEISSDESYTEDDVNEEENEDVYEDYEGDDADDEDAFDDPLMGLSSIKPQLNDIVEVKELNELLPVISNIDTVCNALSSSCKINHVWVEDETQINASKQSNEDQSLICSDIVLHQPTYTIVYVKNPDSPKNHWHYLIRCPGLNSSILGGFHNLFDDATLNASQEQGIPLEIKECLLEHYRHIKDVPSDNLIYDEKLLTIKEDTSFSLQKACEAFIERHQSLPKENVFFEYTQSLLKQEQHLHTYRLDSEEERLTLSDALKNQKSHEVGLVTLANGDVIAFASVIQPNEQKQLFLFDQLVFPFTDLSVDEVNSLTSLGSLSETLQEKIKAFGGQYKTAALLQHEVEEIMRAVPKDQPKLIKTLSVFIQDKRRLLAGFDVEEFEYIKAELMDSTVDSSLAWLDDLSSTDFTQAKFSGDQIKVFEAFIKDKFDGTKSRIITILNHEDSQNTGLKTVFQDLTENDILLVKFWLRKIPANKMLLSLSYKLNELTSETKNKIKFDAHERSVIFESLCSEQQRLRDFFLKQIESQQQPIERSQDFETLKRMVDCIEFVPCSSQRNMGNTSLLHAFSNAAMAWWALNKRTLPFFQALLPTWHQQEIGSKNNIEAIQQWRKAPEHTLTNDAVIKARISEKKSAALKHQLKNKLVDTLDDLGDEIFSVLAEAEQFMRSMVSAFENGADTWSVQNTNVFFERFPKFIPAGKLILSFLNTSGPSKGSFDSVALANSLAIISEILSEKRLFAEIQSLCSEATAALLEKKNSENVISGDSEISDLYFQDYSSSDWLPQRLRDALIECDLGKTDLSLSDLKVLHRKLLSTFCNAPQAEKEISCFASLWQKMNELSTHLNENTSLQLLRGEFNALKKLMDDLAKDADTVQTAKRLDVFTCCLNTLKNNAVAEIKQAFAAEKTQEQSLAVNAVYWDKACRWASFPKETPEFDALFAFIETEVAFYSNQDRLEALLRCMIKLGLDPAKLVQSTDLPIFFEQSSANTSNPVQFVDKNIPLERSALCKIMNHLMAQLKQNWNCLSKTENQYHRLMALTKEWRALEEKLWKQEIDRIYEESIHQIVNAFLLVAENGNAQDKHFEQNTPKYFVTAANQMNGIQLQTATCCWMAEHINLRKTVLKHVAVDHDDAIKLYDLVQEDFLSFLKQALFIQDAGEGKTPFDTLLGILRPDEQGGSLAEFLEFLPLLKGKIQVQEQNKRLFELLKPHLVEKINQTLKNTHLCDTLLSATETELNKKEWFNFALSKDADLKKALLEASSGSDLLEILTQNSRFSQKVPGLLNLYDLLQDMPINERSVQEARVFKFLDANILSHFKDINIEKMPPEHNLEQSKQYVVTFEAAFLSTILSVFYSKYQDWEQYGTHLVLQGKDTLYIDQDLTLPGVNLKIVCPEQILHGLKSFNIDVSGRNGLSVPVLAPIRTGDAFGVDGHGYAGINGVNGNPGQNAGNVWIEGNVLPQIIVKSHGGQGSNGQDGGNGENGRDGRRPHDLIDILSIQNQNDKNKTLLELFNKAIEEQTTPFSSQFSFTSTRVMSAAIEIRELDHDKRIVLPGRGGAAGEPGIGGANGSNGKITIKHEANLIKNQEKDAFKHAPSLQGKSGQRGKDGKPVDPAQKIYVIFDQSLGGRPGRKSAWFRDEGRLLVPGKTFDVNQDEFVFDSAPPDPGEYRSFLAKPLKEWPVTDAKGRHFKIDILKFGYHLPPSQKAGSNFSSFFSTLFAPNNSHKTVLRKPGLISKQKHQVLQSDLNQETQADAESQTSGLEMQASASSLSQATQSSGIAVDARQSSQGAQANDSTQSFASILLAKVSNMLGLSSHTQADHASESITKADINYNSQADLTLSQQKNAQMQSRMASIKTACTESTKQSTHQNATNQQTTQSVPAEANEQHDAMNTLNVSSASPCTNEQIKEAFEQRLMMDEPQNTGHEFPKEWSTLCISETVLERLKKTHIKLWVEVLEETAYNSAFIQFIIDTKINQADPRIETLLFYFNRVRMNEKERAGDDQNGTIFTLMDLIKQSVATMPKNQDSLEIIHILAKGLYRKQMNLKQAIQLVTEAKDKISVDMVREHTLPVEQTHDHRTIQKLIDILKTGDVPEPVKNKLMRIQKDGLEIKSIVDNWKGEEEQAEKKIDRLLARLQALDKDKRDDYFKQHRILIFAALLFKWYLTSKDVCCPFERLSEEQFNALKTSIIDREPKLDNDILLNKLRVLNSKDYLSASFTAREYSDIKSNVRDDFSLVEPAGIVPRDTQLLSLLLFAFKDESNSGVGNLSKGLFQQINTGEGKTLIVGITSAWFALSDKAVDVVSSNRDLAVDGLDKCKPYFDSLGLSSGCNAADASEPELYNYDIIYGTVQSFKSARLEDVSGQGAGTGTRYPGKLRCDPNRNVLIGDECDSLCLDKATDVLYLSHESEMMKKLDTVFTRIWALAQLEESENEQEAINNVAQNVMDDLFLVIDDFEPDLKALIDVHLETWVKNAFTACGMQTNEYFTLSRDQITIMDKDTGTEQHSSRWGDALSIFLDMRFNRKTCPESLRAVFLSLKKFFSMYGHQVCGLSGTLGDRRSRDCSKELYDVASIDIPTSLPKNYIQEDGKVAITRAQWVANLVASALARSQKGPVLIVCDSLHMAGDIESNQQTQGDDSSLVVLIQQEIEKQKLTQVCKLHTYVKEGDDVETKFNSQHPASIGDIIITTNKGGRGTDIKIDKPLIQSGIGLHVIMSFIPKNIRIEQQGFGRASRNGEPGSGEFNIQVQPALLCGHPDFPNHDATIEKIRLLRDAQEAERLIELPLEVLKKEVEEDLLQAFLQLTKGSSDKHAQTGATSIRELVEEIGLKRDQNSYEALFANVLKENNRKDFERGNPEDIFNQGMELYKDILKDKWAWWLKKQETAIDKLHDKAGAQSLITQFSKDWPSDQFNTQETAGSVIQHLKTLGATPDHFIRFGYYYALNHNYARAHEMFLTAQTLGDKTGAASTALAYCKVNLGASATKKQKQDIRRELKNGYADLKKRHVLMKSEESYHANQAPSSSQSDASGSGKNKHSLVSQYSAKAQILGFHQSNIEQLAGCEFEAHDFKEDTVEPGKATDALYKMLMKEGVLQAPILRARYRKTPEDLKAAISKATCGNVYLSEKLSTFLTIASQDKQAVQTFEREQLEDFVCSNEECMTLLRKESDADNESSPIFLYEIDLIKAERMLPQVIAEGPQQAWVSFKTRLGITADFEMIQINRDELLKLVADKDAPEMNQLVTFLNQNGCLRTKAKLKYSQLDIDRFASASKMSAEDKYFSLRYKRQDYISIELVDVLPKSMSDACQNRIYLKKNSEKKQYEYTLKINEFWTQGAFSADEFEDSLDAQTLQNLLDQESDVSRRLRNRVLSYIKPDSYELNIMDEINSFKNYIAVLKEKVEIDLCPVELQVVGAKESSSLKHCFLFRPDQLSLDLSPQDMTIIEQSELDSEIKNKIKQQLASSVSQTEENQKEHSFSSIQLEAIQHFLKNQSSDLADKIIIGRWCLSYCSDNENFVEDLYALTEEECEILGRLLDKNSELGPEQKKKLHELLTSAESTSTLSESLQFNESSLRALKETIALSPVLKTKYLLVRKEIDLTVKKNQDLLSKLRDCSLHQVAFKNNDSQFKEELLTLLPNDITSDMTSREYLVEHPYFYLDQLPFGTKADEAAKLMTQLKEARIIKFGGLGGKYKYDNQDGFNTSLDKALEKIFVDQPIPFNRNVFKKVRDTLKTGVGFIRGLGEGKQMAASYIPYREMAHLSDDEEEPGELSFFSPVHQHQYLFLEEKKESNLWSIVLVSVLALAQLIAGGLLMVVSPNVGLALIGEGVGDIIQVVLAIKTGEMSMRDYWQGKLIGLTIMAAVGSLRFLSKLALVSKIMNVAKSSKMAQALGNFATKTKNAFVNIGKKINESRVVTSFKNFCSNTGSWIRNSATKVQSKFKSLLNALKGSVRMTARSGSNLLRSSSLYKNVSKYGKIAVTYLKFTSMAQLISRFASKAKSLIVRMLNATFKTIKEYGVRVIKFFRGSLAKSETSSRGWGFLKAVTLEGISQGAVATLEEVLSRRILESVSKALASMIANIAIQRNQKLEQLKQRLLELYKKNPLSFKNACSELCDAIGGKGSVLPEGLKGRLDHAARSCGLAMRAEAQVVRASAFKQADKARGKGMFKFANGMHGLANMLRMANNSLALSYLNQEVSSINDMISGTFESIVDAYDACGEGVNTEQSNEDHLALLNETINTISKHSDEYIEQHVHRFLQMQVNHHVSMGINHYLSTPSPRDNGVDAASAAIKGKAEIKRDAQASSEKPMQMKPKTQQWIEVDNTLKTKRVKPAVTLSLSSAQRPRQENWVSEPVHAVASLQSVSNVGGQPKATIRPLRSVDKASDRLNTTLKRVHATRSIMKKALELQVARYINTSISKESSLFSLQQLAAFHYCRIDLYRDGKLIKRGVQSGTNSVARLNVITDPVTKKPIHCQPMIDIGGKLTNLEPFLNDNLPKGDRACAPRSLLVQLEYMKLISGKRLTDAEKIQCAQEAAKKCAQPGFVKDALKRLKDKASAHSLLAPSSARKAIQTLCGGAAKPVVKASSKVKVKKMRTAVAKKSPKVSNRLAPKSSGMHLLAFNEHPASTEQARIILSGIAMSCSKHARARLTRKINNSSQNHIYSDIHLQNILTQVLNSGLPQDKLSEKMKGFLKDMYETKLPDKKYQRIDFVAKILAKEMDNYNSALALLEDYLKNPQQPQLKVFIMKVAATASRNFIEGNANANSAIRAHFDSPASNAEHPRVSYMRTVIEKLLKAFDLQHDNIEPLSQSNGRVNAADPLRPDAESKYIIKDKDGNFYNYSSSIPLPPRDFVTLMGNCECTFPLSRANKKSDFKLFKTEGQNNSYEQGLIRPRRASLSALSSHGIFRSSNIPETLDYLERGNTRSSDDPHHSSMAIDDHLP